MAEEAVNEFKEKGLIPNLGQRIHEGMGPGAVHVFPDGTIAVHWDDGDFTLGELKEYVP